MWISLKFGIFFETVLAVIIFIIMFIITLIRAVNERARTKNEFSKLKSYSGFMANILTFVASLLLLFLTSGIPITGIVDFLDHRSLIGLLLPIGCFYFLCYFILLKLLRKR